MCPAWWATQARMQTLPLLQCGVLTPTLHAPVSCLFYLGIIIIIIILIYTNNRIIEKITLNSVWSASSRSLFPHSPWKVKQHSTWESTFVQLYYYYYCYCYCCRFRYCYFSKIHQTKIFHRKTSSKLIQKILTLSRFLFIRTYTLVR